MYLYSGDKHIGGMVNAKSVKLLERMSNMEEPESRDAWWSELRLEMRSHARALSCNVILGYSENTAIWYRFYAIIKNNTHYTFTFLMKNSH